MYGLVVSVGFLVVVVLFAIWARRRESTVDDYYEREYGDPPVFDGLGRLNGGFFG